MRNEQKEPEEDGQARAPEVIRDDETDRVGLHSRDYGLSRGRRPASPRS